MTRFEEALVAVARFLEGAGVPYMVVGGVANLFWGVPRTTVDVDVTVWVEDQDVASFVQKLAGAFRILPEHPTEFVKETRVLPLEGPEGFRLDLIFGTLPLEQEAIRRARTVSVRGWDVRICAPEDLIVSKIVSDRPRDREDVAGIIQRQRAGLDRRYLDPLIESLASELGRPDLLDFYRSCLGEGR